MKSVTLAALAGALLIAAPFAAVAQSAGSAPSATVTKSQRFVASCLSKDENGRDLPNPNSSSVCGQFRDMNSECAMQERLGNTKALALHCFGFDNVADVQPAPTAPVQYTSGKRR